MADRVTTANTSSSFWLVVLFTAPTYVAFLIVVSAQLYPSVFAYLLIPLAVMSPVSFIVAVILAIRGRHTMQIQRFRIACLVLLLALLAGIAAATVIRLS